MSVSCPTCGMLLPEGSASCPRCLLGMAIDAPTTRFVNDEFLPPKPHELAAAFPNLEIQSLIGQGGMGAVYRARHRVLDRIVALKILPPHLANRPDFAARFEREARALARLNHPNIVGVFDSGQTTGYYYLVMEFVDGVNLRQAIQAGAIEPTQALSIVPQICEALQYAHDQGIVHRDIKPENILLDKQGRVRVADFGLARMLDLDQVSDTLTASRQVMGTPRYMAPEQLEGSHSVDHRADIYSLGVVFYELLTGELPLGRFPAPSQGGAVDRRLDQVVFRTLEKRPDARYQKASQLKTDVESINHSRGRTRSTTFPGYAYREYRSRTTLFGLPFFHYANGIDPRTGRAAVARGIIAVGPKARGALAIGGQAIGIVAIGGLAIGFFTLGGISLGLLMAAGGLAAGLGFSAGGGAFGSIAMGGMALGFTALGGLAFGAYYASGLGSTPPPSEFIFPGIIILVSLLFGFFWPTLLVAYIFSILNSWANSSAPLAASSSSIPPVVGNGPAAKPPRVTSRPSRLPYYMFGALVFGFVGMLAVVGLIMSLIMAPQRVVTYPQIRYGETAAVPQDFDNTSPYHQWNVVTIDGVAVPNHVRSSIPDWVDVQYDGAKPLLSPPLVARLSIVNEKRLAIDAILQKYSAASLELESSQGVVRTVNVLPILQSDSLQADPNMLIPTGMSVEIEITQGAHEEFQVLERAMWAEIDPLVDNSQRNILHQEICALPTGATPPAFSSLTIYMNPGAYPSILGWGGYGGKISVTRVANSYAWKIEHAGSSVSGNGALLPPEILRYQELIQNAARPYQQENVEQPRPTTEPQASLATETPATETPATETPATETPATETPATETPATETPATETPATESTATEGGGQATSDEDNTADGSGDR